jgi:hypothetical protein
VTGAGGSGTVQISPPIISADSSRRRPRRVPERDRHAGQRRRDHLPEHRGRQRRPFWDSARSNCCRAATVRPGPRVCRRRDDAGTTELGVEVVVYKFFDINTKKYKYRVDTRFGVGMTNPEMCGVVLFSQT